MSAGWKTNRGGLLAILVMLGMALPLAGCAGEATSVQTVEVTVTAAPAATAGASTAAPGTAGSAVDWSVCTIGEDTTVPSQFDPRISMCMDHQLFAPWGGGSGDGSTWIDNKGATWEWYVTALDAVARCEAEHTTARQEPPINHRHLTSSGLPVGNPGDPVWYVDWFTEGNWGDQREYLYVNLNTGCLVSAPPT